MSIQQRYSKDNDIEKIVIGIIKKVNTGLCRAQRGLMHKVMS